MNVHIRSTAGDGVWLDGIGGLVRGVQPAGESEPLVRDLVVLDDYRWCWPGSDGVWTARGLICPAGGLSVKAGPGLGDGPEPLPTVDVSDGPKHVNCRCVVKGEVL